jgi:hypothetical protein
MHRDIVKYQRANLIRGSELINQRDS